MGQKKLLESDIFGILRSLNIPGIGDDCAVIPLGWNESLVMTADAIRGKYFSLFKEGILTHRDLGRYLVSANLSDIAAMGAYPIAFLNTFRYEEATEVEEAIRFFQGMKNALAEYGLTIAGGDTGSAVAENMTGFAVGRGRTDNLLFRSGARPGDLLCVTGFVGTMNAALVALNKPNDMQFISCGEALAESWRRPPARIREGLALSGISKEAPETRSKLASACMDASDGLRTAIMQLGAASGVGFELYGDQIPCNGVVDEVAEFYGRKPYEIQLGIAPDFELVFTLPSSLLEEAVARFSQEGLESFSVIGKAVEKGFRFHESDSLPALAEFPGENWNHQGIGPYLSQFMRA